MASSSNNIDDLIRQQINKQALEEERGSIMDDTGNALYELCAMMINEEKPAFRAARHEAVVTQLRALSRFFAIDAMNTHGVPGHLIEQSLRAADELGSKMTMSPLADDRISAIKTPFATGLVDSAGRKLKYMKDT